MKAQLQKNQTSPPDGSTTKSYNEIQETLKDIDKNVGNGAEIGPTGEPLNVADNVTDKVSDVAAIIEPPPFLVQTLGGIVAKGVEVSKKMGWSGPGVAGVFTEAEWQQAITTNAAIVIQKRWPSLADNTTPELALLCLALPWLMWAIPQGFTLLKKRNGTSHSDTRGTGNGKDNAHAETSESVFPSFFDRPNA